MDWLNPTALVLATLASLVVVLAAGWRALKLAIFTILESKEGRERLEEILEIIARGRAGSPRVRTEAERRANDERMRETVRDSPLVRIGGGTAASPDVASSIARAAGRFASAFGEKEERKKGRAKKTRKPSDED